jgi:hypothetical protein
MFHSLALVSFGTVLSNGFLVSPRYDINRCTRRDTESAMHAIHNWLLLKYLVGSALEGLEADAFLYFKQMKALKRDPTAYHTKSWRQVFLNLMGRDNVDKPTRLSGESLTVAEFERYRDNPYIGSLFFVHQGMLFTYFDEYVHYADMVIQLGHDHFQNAQIASPNNLWDTFLKGVACFAAARETGKRKYVKVGRIFRSKINKWLNMGNPNVKHYGSLLDAEWLAFKGDMSGAIKHYELATLLSARGGYQQDAALATERFGEFYSKVVGDREEAAYQISQSIKYWGQWGAVAKVRHLEEKYADLLLRKQ